MMHTDVSHASIFRPYLKTIKELFRTYTEIEVSGVRVIVFVSILRYGLTAFSFILP